MGLDRNAKVPAVDERFAREAIEGGIERVLNHGRWGNPDVLLVRLEGIRFVVKDFSPRSRVVRTLFGRWLLRREARAYARLADLPLIPRPLGWIDRDAFALEYRPGVPLSRSLADRVPSAFLTELTRGIEAMHERGVVHLDLRHRSNILAGDDGHPVILDFASAFCFEPGSAAGRAGRALLSWIDRRALEKWRVRLMPPESPARPERAEREGKTVAAERV